MHHNCELPGGEKERIQVREERNLIVQRTKFTRDIRNLNDPIDTVNCYLPSNLPLYTEFRLLVSEGIVAQAITNL